MQTARSRSSLSVYDSRTPFLLALLLVLAVALLAGCSASDDTASGDASD